MVDLVFGGNPHLQEKVSKNAEQCIIDTGIFSASTEEKCNTNNVSGRGTKCSRALKVRRGDSFRFIFEPLEKAVLSLEEMHARHIGSKWNSPKILPTKIIHKSEEWFSFKLQA